MSAVGIHKDIEATLAPDAIGYSTVTKYLREAQITHDSEPSPTSIGKTQFLEEHNYH
jgi:hypothetical protein